VILRGANVMRSEWQADLNSSWEERAIPEFATQWHGNVLTRGFASSPVNSGHGGYLGMLDEVVSLAETNRMYIILAWRSYDIDGEQPAMPDEDARRALVSLAARYRGRSHVMYALQVEPHNDDTGGDDDSWHTLRPLFEAMVDDIRRAAAPFEPLVLIPGTNWSRNLTGAVRDPVRRPNVVYKSHPYNPSSDFQALFGTAHDAGLPVFIGEFGPKQPNDPVNVMTMEDVAALLAFIRQRNISWAAWLLDYGTYALMNFGDLSPTTPYGAAVQAETLTNPPIAGETITIDDSEQGPGPNKWNYQGSGWQHCTDCDETSIRYHNASQSWTATTNDTAQLTFLGRQVHVFGVTAPWHGIAAVSIDGGTQTMIDLYSPSKIGNVWLWTSPVLTTGQHTFTLRVTGNKNAASTGTVVAVDRAEIAS
jgi:hypothetical protein